MLRYGGMFRGVRPEQNASHCADCGKCSEACPQHIAIAGWLKKMHLALTS
jgi:predicted aldo/keto reductase-like oxidoreductase